MPIMVNSLRASFLLSSAMTGKLNGDMMPDFSSLTGNGNLLLLQGILKKFAPLEKLANTLQIDELKEVSVKDIKNYIEFANGKVLVKPFSVKVKGHRNVDRRNAWL